MDRITKFLGSPDLWIGGIIIGFLVNIAAAYAKPAFDWVGARYSLKRRSKLEKRREEFIQQASKTLTEANGVVLLAVKELRHIVFGVLYLLVFLASGYALDATMATRPIADRPGVALLIYLGVTVFRFAFLTAAMVQVNRAFDAARLLSVVRGVRDAPDKSSKS